MPDEMLRAACFASLDVLCAQFGDDVPYKGGLDRGFPHGGARVPFLSPQKGIFRAAAQTGPAALSINTSSKSPYGDAEVDDGYLYAYRAGSVDQPDNRALRQAFALQVPLVYFVATRPGWYRPLYPAYIAADDPVAQRVLVSPGQLVGPLDERDPKPLENPIERRYAVRETRVRRASGGLPWPCPPRLREHVHDLPAEGGSPARRSAHRRRPRGARRADRPERTEPLLHPPSRVRPAARRRVA